jgi:hypothetical protein
VRGREIVIVIIEVNIICMYVYTYVCMFVCMYLYTYVHTYGVCMCVCVCVRVFIHVHKLSVRTSDSTRAHVCGATCVREPPAGQRREREAEDEGLFKGRGAFRQGARIFAFAFAHERLFLLLMRGVFCCCCVSDPSFGIE